MSLSSSTAHQNGSISPSWIDGGSINAHLGTVSPFTTGVIHFKVQDVVQILFKPFLIPSSQISPGSIFPFPQTIDDGVHPPLVHHHSFIQVLEHQSQFDTFPSSHCSPGSSFPSPQVIDDHPHPHHDVNFTSWLQPLTACASRKHHMVREAFPVYVQAPTDPEIIWPFPQSMLCTHCIQVYTHVPVTVSADVCTTVTAGVVVKSHVGFLITIVSRHAL